MSDVHAWDSGDSPSMLHTVPPEDTSRLLPSASQPTMVAISLINALTSRAFVLWERSWESFARTHGWVDTWAFIGSESIVYFY